MGVTPIRPLELMKDENITKSEFNDFIGIWENFVPPYVCQKTIDFFEETISVSTFYNEDLASDEFGVLDGTGQFQNGSLGRKDLSILLNYSNPKLNYELQQYLTACTHHYVDTYDQLKNAKLIAEDNKMQKTPPGGGYHVWHYENAGYGHHARELVWAIYLNDMPDGEAETEFLYQRRRIKPTVGTVVIWPAGMTHVHKGNTVFTQDKYILTGWFIKAP
jgi:hypothetical protein